VAVSVLILCVRLKYVIIATPRSLYLLEGTPAPIVRLAVWITETVWTGVKESTSLAHSGVQTLNLSAHNESLSCIKVLLNFLVLYSLFKLSSI
jgi:hypothetical protein